MLDSSLSEDELEDPDSLELEPVEDSVLVEGVVDSVPELPEDSLLVAVPLELEEAEAVVAAFLLESAGSWPEASCT